jgi:hypothetical protein
MKTVKELISHFENAPKRKGIRYVNQDDVADAITVLKTFEKACDTFVQFADYMGILNKEQNENA